MPSSVVSASKRDSTTMWLPVQSAWVEKTNGPLWYSGPGTRWTPSSPMPNGPSRSGFAVAGAPDRMILGRPVLPPDVGAFHDAAIGSSGNGSSPSAGSGTIGSMTTSAGSASSMIAARSRSGQPVRDGLRRRAALPRRDRGLVERDPVRQADGDEVVGPDSRGAHVPRQPVRAALELATRDRALAPERAVEHDLGDRRAIGIALRPRAQRGCDRRVPDFGHERRCGQAFLGISRNGLSRSTLGSRGRPSTRSPMMLCWISSVPP